ncbi:MAG: MOSC N-terminal beta barrel domain-containing protein [Pseudomonadota bacterium]
MPILTELNLYPIKSCAGMSVPEATLTRAGLAFGGIHDREWMVVREDGQFMTQRDYPRMALIVPRLDDGALVLSAPGMAPLTLALAVVHDTPTVQVQVWDDTVQASECGAAGAAWFSQALGVACRLVRFHADAVRLASRTWTGAIEAPTLFSDGYPLLLAGRSSLEDLNQKLVAAGRAALPMNRFRPNLVVEGMEAFEEDYVETFELGAARLKPVKPCPRCPMPSVDQASGCVGPDPLDILQAYRRKAQVDDAVCFGMNCIVTAGEGERLRVGQAVAFVLAF